MQTSIQKAPAGSAAETLVNFGVLPDEARLKTATVCALLAWSRTTLWRRVKGGKFPSPIREDTNVARWRVGDVRKHLQMGATV